MRAVAVAALLALVVTAGCGGDETALEGASTEPVTVAGSSTSTALLTDVDVGAEDGVERVTFTFANEVPGYDVRYVPPPVHADGSGEPVPVAGEAVLRVRLEPALDADLTQEGAPATYTGPRRISPDTELVQEVARVGGFEAVLTWAIGVSEPVPFKVTASTEPPRVIVELEGG